MTLDPLEYSVRDWSGRYALFLCHDEDIRTDYDLCRLSEVYLLVSSVSANEDARQAGPM